MVVDTILGKGKGNKLTFIFFLTLTSYERTFTLPEESSIQN